MLATSRSSWSLQDWLAHLESIQPVKFNLRLENVRAVAKLLEVADAEPVVITVAGTNGKGSTVAALDSIYSHAGYKVGCFTSPHLISFNERITVANKQISSADATRIMLAIEKVRGDIELSYFETAFLCALVYFKEASLDLIILEVGMGGRLDATNIIDADLAIITSIALDHQQYLGEDLLKIGHEKAGIMRPGRPCIFADAKRPITIDNYAQAIDSDLYSLGEDYTYQKQENKLQVSVTKQSTSRNLIGWAQGSNMNLPIPKIQANSAAAAIISSSILQEYLPVSIEVLQKSMQEINILARQQLIERDNMQILLDVAHNPHAANSLADYVKYLNIQGKVHAIFTGLAEKDLSGMVAPLLNVVDHWYPTSISCRRAATFEEVCSTLNTHVIASVNIHAYADPLTAYKQVLQRYNAGDLVIIYGSFLLVGVIMENFGNEVSYV